MAVKFGLDVVNGIVIGEVENTRYYEFHSNYNVSVGTFGEKTQCIYSGHFKDDKEAIEAFKNLYTKAFNSGSEMRVWD